MPSDENNYIYIIPDPFRVKNCFPFSNPSQIDNTVNFLLTPISYYFQSWYLHWKLTYDLREFRGFHLRSAPNKSWGVLCHVVHDYFYIERDLENKIRKFTLRVTWLWRTRSRLIVTVWIHIYLTSATPKTCETKKDHCSSVTSTRVRTGHAQGHVTLTYKVTLDSYSVDLYLFDIRDPKNLRNKKRSSL